MDDKKTAIMNELKEMADVIGEKMVKGAKIVGNKAGETAETAALNVKIKKTEGEIRELYRRIGEITYNNAALELEDQEDITPLVCEVDAKLLEIESFKNEIVGVKKKYAEKREAVEDVSVEIITEEEAEAETEAEEASEEAVEEDCGEE